MKPESNDRPANAGFGAAPLLGVNEFDNRIKCLRNLFLAFVCLLASEACCLGNQPIKLQPSLAAEIINNRRGGVSEIRNLVLVKGGECALWMKTVGRLGVQLVHESAEHANPAASLTAGEQPVTEISTRKMTQILAISMKP